MKSIKVSLNHARFYFVRSPNYTVSQKTCHPIFVILFITLAVFAIFYSKRIGVASLFFLCHVTSSVTWSSDP